MIRLAVVTDHPFERELRPGAIPTPRLAQVGRGEAYFVAAESPGMVGVWYLREPGYESPDGTYSRVRVIQTELPADREERSRFLAEWAERQ